MVRGACRIGAIVSMGVFLALANTVRAEEGMWTLDNLPRELLQEQYGFAPDADWLQHVRLASVMLVNEGSGAFVSGHGLVVTNHHVAAGQLQKMSTADKDYYRDGFYARRLEDEIPCPDLEIDVLVGMRDVTAQIQAAGKKGSDLKAAHQARLAAIAAVEQQSQQETGLKSEVVSLYHGGEYWLYQYRKYTDVRLVMAPEKSAAFFGGDPDNFTYPRFDLDLAFFRVYQAGKPLTSEHYLRFNTRLQEGELVFVTGHPGQTDRLLTMAQLDYLRAQDYVLRKKFIDHMTAVLEHYAASGAEQQRRAHVHLFSLANSRKAYIGMLKTLDDERLMGRLRVAEEALRSQVRSDAEMQRRFGSAWTDIADLYQRQESLLIQETLLYYHREWMGSQLVRMAIQLVQLAEETAKPDGERLDKFRESQLPSLKFELLSKAPLYPDLEIARMVGSLEFLRVHLPAGSPVRKAIVAMGELSPLAESLISKTGLGDPAARQALLAGGQKAIAESQDPLIAWARDLAPLLSQARRQYKQEVESVLTPATEKIAQARFAVYGKNTYPDATSTLRMTFGKVSGYPMNGTRAPFQTTLYGLYDRSLGFGQQGDWKLSPRFWERQSRLDLSTPANFVCACDIIGGNSGSPVINRAAELVGVVFDGNIEMLASRFVFDCEHSRGVAVHAAYIIEALRKLYDAEDLADELQMASGSRDGSR